RLRGASNFERAFIFAGVVLVEIPYAMILLSSFLWPSLLLPQDASRLEVIAVNLGSLCLVCAFAARFYSTRILQPDGRPLPLKSWQSLMWAIAPVAALPICAIVLAVVIPPASDAFEIVFPISIIGAVVLLVAYLSMRFRRRAAV
ncbi:MAG: hypothetical protein ACXVDA_26615, partial [Ktedonobacterales bacterium]